MDAQLILDAVAELVRDQTLDLQRSVTALTEENQRLRVEVKSALDGQRELAGQVEKAESRIQTTAASADHAVELLETHFDEEVQKVAERLDVLYTSYTPLQERVDGLIKDQDHILEQIDAQPGDSSRRIAHSLTVEREKTDKALEEVKSTCLFQLAELSQRLEEAVATQATGFAQRADEFEKRLTGLVPRGEVRQIRDEIDALVGEVKAAITALDSKYAETTTEQGNYIESSLVEALKATSTLSANVDKLKSYFEETFQVVRAEVSHSINSLSTKHVDLQEAFDKASESFKMFVNQVDEGDKDVSSRIETLDASLKLTASTLLDVDKRVDAAQTLAALAADKADDLSEMLAKTSETVREDVHNLMTSLERDIKEVNTEIPALVEKAAMKMREQYEAVEDWKRGGAGYQKFAVVRHRGALWQTPVATASEPGKGETWVLLADGIADASVECNEDGMFEFKLRMASGTELTTQHQLPVVRFKGVYDPKAQYRRFDAMVKDGCTFLALKDAPGEVGAERGEWMTIGYRGKAGRRGPTLDEVSDDLRPQLVRALMAELPDLVALAVQAQKENDQ